MSQPDQKLTPHGGFLTMAEFLQDESDASDRGRPIIAAPRHALTS
jgi:hypothetical protein